MLRTCWLLFILLIISFSNYAQDNAVFSVNNVAGKLIDHLHSASHEKILVQTNRQVYDAGGVIFFKAFIVDSLSGKMTAASKLLFADLVDNKDSVLSRVILDAQKFQTNGSFKLPDTLTHGYYWLRAYTENMINGNTNNIGLLPVYILNPQKADIPGNFSDVDHNGAGVVPSKIILNIYPEGGAVISGTSSIVGVKVNDESGKPLAVSGIVKDKRNIAVANFTTNAAGLAKFEFSPAWYGRYSVFIGNNEKYDSVAQLPPVNLFAARVSVAAQSDQFIKAQVMLEDSLYTPDYTTYLLGISKDSLCFAASGKGMYELDIPVSNFPGGPVNLLLFNSGNQLLSERDVFINKKNILVNISADKQNYAARENVKIDINITDAGGKPLQAALSMSVADSRTADTSIIFNKNQFDNTLNGDEELAMLFTGGLIKNEMERIPEKKAASSYGLNDIFNVQGKVITKKNEVLPGKEVTLMSNENSVFVMQDTTDANGRFSFHLPGFSDSSKFNLQVSNMKGNKEDYAIIPDEPVFPHISTPAGLKKSYFENQELFAQNIKRLHIDSIITGRGKEWLEPVIVKTKESSKIKKIDSSGIITQEMLRNGGVNNIGMAVLRTGKFHLLGGFVIEGGPNGFVPSTFDEPIVVMNGVQVTLQSSGDPSETSPVLIFLKSLNTDDIDYINVLSGTEGGIYGVRSGHGVIEIHTTTQLKNYATATGLKIIYREGFYMPAVFAMPDYNNREIKNSRIQDLRTAIYWNGDIITDKTGHATVNFFTADIPAIYILTITGTTTGGEKIYKTIALSRK